MALDQFALLEVLEALKSAEVGDRVRAAAETIYQALVEAELTEFIGAAAHEPFEPSSSLALAGTLSGVAPRTQEHDEVPGRSLDHSF